MNDFVLRGFCQKCNRPQIFGETINHNVGGGVWEDCEPVWFLSPNQMRIIWTSKEFSEWKKNVGVTQDSTIASFIEWNLFLVASILARAGEEKGVI